MKKRLRRRPFAEPQSPLVHLSAPLRYGRCRHHPAIPARYITRMILYKPGTQFLYKGRTVSVDYVIIKRTGLWIRLAHSEEVCRPEDLTPIAPQGAGLTR